MTEAELWREIEHPLLAVFSRDDTDAYISNVVSSCKEYVDSILKIREDELNAINNSIVEAQNELDKSISEKRRVDDLMSASKSEADELLSITAGELRNRSLQIELAKHELKAERKKIQNILSKYIPVKQFLCEKIEEIERDIIGDIGEKKSDSLRAARLILIDTINSFPK